VNESDKTLKHALKVIANATAYGAFVELNEQRELHYIYRKVKGQKKRIRECRRRASAGEAVRYRALC